MSTDITPARFDYNALGRPQRQHLKSAATAIKAAIARTQNDILEIGRRLIDVKENLDDQRFSAWVRAEFDMSRSAAYRFMDVAKAFGTCPNVGQLEFDKSALYALASPSTSDEARNFAIEYAGTGEPITRAVAKEIIAAHAPPAPAVPSIPDHQDFDDSDPFPELAGHIPPPEALPPHETESDRAQSTIEPQAAPRVEIPTTPDGAFVAETTETMNAHLPAPPAAPAAPSKMLKADEDAMPDDEWLSTLPAWPVLAATEHHGERFRASALAFRAMQPILRRLKHESGVCIEEDAPDEFPARLLLVNSIKHPREWPVCRTCHGTMFFEGASCSCKGGYRLW